MGLLLCIAVCFLTDAIAAPAAQRVSCSNAKAWLFTACTLVLAFAFLGESYLLATAVSEVLPHPLGWEPPVAEIPRPLPGSGTITLASVQHYGVMGLIYFVFPLMVALLGIVMHRLRKQRKAALVAEASSSRASAVDDLTRPAGP